MFDQLHIRVIPLQKIVSNRIPSRNDQVKGQMSKLLKSAKVDGHGKYFQDTPIFLLEVSRRLADAQHKFTQSNHQINH